MEKYTESHKSQSTGIWWDIFSTSVCQIVFMVFRCSACSLSTFWCVWGVLTMASSCFSQMAAPCVKSSLSSINGAKAAQTKRTRAVWFPQNYILGESHRKLTVSVNENANCFRLQVNYHYYCSGNLELPEKFWVGSHLGDPLFFIYLSIFFKIKLLQFPINRLCQKCLTLISD